MSQNNIDVLIVGAGPVGLFCANELIRHGLTCRIIDKKTTISDQSKALGIHIRTLDVLEGCGFLDAFLKQGQKVNGALLKSNGKLLAHLDFKHVQSDKHWLIDLPQNKTEAILYQSLKDKGVDVEWNTELTYLSQSPNEVTATIKKPNNKIELLNSNWIIACDGAHSTVRHELHAEFNGAAYQQTWWLADLLIDWDISQHDMAIYLNDKGPLACFPMGNKRYRLVMTAPKNNVIGDPSLDDIQQEFNKRSSDKAILSNPIWLTQFSIHHRQIEHYCHHRVFFAGDAAHIHSPMGGQGLNTGLQDVYNLVWKLALVEKGYATPELLASYHEERFPIGEAVLKNTDKMTKMILITNPLLVKIRNTFIACLASFKWVKNRIASNLAELTISYAKSPIVHRQGRAKDLKPGTYLPEFKLTRQHSLEQVSSVNIIQGISHHLFIFSGLNPAKIPELIRLANTLSEKYPNTIKVHLVLAKNTDSIHSSFDTWFDEQQLHKKFKLKKATLLLIRPDKYIGFLQTPINLKKLEEHLYLLS